MWLSKDSETFEKWKNLMTLSGLDTNEEIDYSIGLFDKEHLIATGSTKNNIIKCLAVKKEFQSENLLVTIVQEIINHLRDEDINHFFLYTKPENKLIFKSLGFKEIISTDLVLFMEQGIPGFSDYITKLERVKCDKHPIGSIVMNANPFTKGHQYLVEKAVKKCEHVYVFVLTENLSEFSSVDRFNMVKLGVSHLNNVTVLPTDDYMISSATFPTYFLNGGLNSPLVEAQAMVDATLFKEKIAPILDITYRFVGEEPFSPTTRLYNEAMNNIFKGSIQLEIIPRKSIDGNIISATKVREAIKENNTKLLLDFLPQTTYDYINKMKR